MTLYLTHMGEHTTLYKSDSYSHNTVFHTGVRTHMGIQKECNKEIGGGWQVRRQNLKSHVAVLFADQVSF